MTGGDSGCRRVNYGNDVFYECCGGGPCLYTGVSVR